MKNQFQILTLVTVWVVCVSLCLGQDQDDTETGGYVSHGRKLYHKLMAYYVQSIRPVKNESETVDVTMSLKIVAIEDVKEQEQALYVTGWTRQSWVDFQLAWNPEDFGGVTTMELSSHVIWTPEVAVVNSKSMYLTDLAVHQLVTVHYTGKVVWPSLSNIVTECYMDLADYPYDTQKCAIWFASWSYPTSKMNLSVERQDLNEEHSRPTFEFQHSSRNWEVTDLRVTIDPSREMGPVSGEYSDGQHNEIGYHLSLRRISSFASHLFVAPSVVLCFITPLVFLLPPASHEKITLGVGVLISDVLLLGELSKFLPAAYLTMPLLGKYLLANIILTSLSLVISTIVINVWGRSRTRLNMPGPAFIRLIILGKVAKLLCVSENQYCENDDDKPDDHGNSVNLSDMENRPNDPAAQSNAARSREMKVYLRKVAMSQWSQLAVVIDRFFIILYLVVIILLTLSFTQYM